MNKLIVFAILGLLLTTTAFAFTWKPTSIYTRLCNNADLDDNGVVNALDLGVARFSYSGEEDDICWFNNDWCGETDQNFDGQVDGSDSLIVEGWLGKECPVE